MRSGVSALSCGVVSANQRRPLACEGDGLGRVCRGHPPDIILVHSMIACLEVVCGCIYLCLGEALRAAYHEGHPFLF